MVYSDVITVPKPTFTDQHELILLIRLWMLPFLLCCFCSVAQEVATIAACRVVCLLQVCFYFCVSSSSILTFTSHFSLFLNYISFSCTLQLPCPSCANIASHSLPSSHHLLLLFGSNILASVSTGCRLGLHLSPVAFWGSTSYTFSANNSFLQFYCCLYCILKRHSLIWVFLARI